MKTRLSLALALLTAGLLTGSTEENTQKLSLTGSGTSWAMLGPALEWDKFRQIQGEAGARATIKDFDLDKVKARAMEGHVSSQLVLAYSYLEGKHGLPVSAADAYQWASLSRECGSDTGKWLSKELELYMTPQELANAKKAAQALSPKKR